MLRRTWVLMIALALIAAVPALAGDHKKCKESTQDCLDHMAAKMKNHGWIGVELDHDDATGALAVVKVIPGSPAEDAGIQPGDLFLTMNGIQVNEENEKTLEKAWKEWKPGQTVTYTVKRDGTDRQVAITLAPMPADVLAKWIGQHMLEHAGVESEGK